jgi:hypothetical protein
MGEEVRGLAPSDEGKRRLWDDSSIRPLERGEGRRMAAQWRGSERWLSGTVPRRKKEKGTGRAMGRSGRVGRMPLGPARMTGPKWKIGFGFDFPILFQGFELKMKGFKYFQIKFELRSN